LGDHAKPRARFVPRAERADVSVAGSLESYTAKEANKVLRRKGQFWQEDYWDTFMRDEEHELKTRRYIENNSTKAKLVAFRKDWPWSSARFRDSYERLCLPDR